VVVASDWWSEDWGVGGFAGCCAHERPKKISTTIGRKLEADFLIQG